MPQILPGGTTRSEAAPRYDLVPSTGPRRIAKRFNLGAEKHGENNWKLSIQKEADAFIFCREAYNHMVEHQAKMIAMEEPDEDHLGAIGWAVTVIMHVEWLYGKPWMTLSRGNDSESIGS